ncbi:NAD(P)-dependent oxidoreductase [Rhodoferax sediminis]|uniref:Hydroxyacid dehydrogenase n=1 Tax=Rhodoferax sediminis TaxID=2509614 RepID=A0A515DET7_9BURK|nr:NAD(P)-dependent oxidoreductase [Rhodoferax sediminis]QDL38932.1 hydroxyacid dehydrogenase [Rhodoferax sediminis]
MDILLLETLIPQARQWLEARHTVSYQPQLADDPSALRRAVYKTQALLVTPKVAVTRELLDFAPRLKVIACLFDDTDNMDLEACYERGIRMIRPASAPVRAQAEYLLGGLLMLLRRGFGVSLGGSRRPDIRLGRELGDSVIGILGLTPAAHTLAHMLAPLGAKLIGYEPALHHSAAIWERLHIQPVGLAELMAQADAVSLQMLYASRYAGFINDAALMHCKPGQAWVSISRSALFEPQALASALRDGRIDACLLDGVDYRLVSEGAPLHGLNNLIVTPRVAAHTRESRLRANWYLVDRMHEAAPTTAGMAPAGLSSVAVAAG